MGGCRGQRLRLALAQIEMELRAEQSLSNVWFLLRSQCFQSSCLSLSRPPGKVAQCMTEQGKNWPGLNESFLFCFSNGRSFSFQAEKKYGGQRIWK